MDQQNLSLVKLLLTRGADPNLVSSGGHTPYHLTYGRHDDNIRKELYATTDPDLRELPDSESDDSEGEEDEGSDDEVCARGETRRLSRHRTLAGWVTSRSLPGGLRRHPVERTLAGKTGQRDEVVPRGLGR